MTHFIEKNDDFDLVTFERSCQLNFLQKCVYYQRSKHWHSGLPDTETRKANPDKMFKQLLSVIYLFKVYYAKSNVESNDCALFMFMCFIHLLPTGMLIDCDTFYIEFQ